VHDAVQASRDEAHNREGADHRQIDNGQWLDAEQGAADFDLELVAHRTLDATSRS
jgi:hypothetical protein